MPKLLVFAPCERVIISQEENAPTLISLLTDIKIEVDLAALEAANAKSKKKPMSPLRWNVFALWMRTPEDQGKSYMQRVELCGPEPHHDVLLKGEIALAMTTSTHRVTVNLPGFPVVSSGVHSVRLFLDDLMIAAYPISVTIAKPAATHLESSHQTH